MRRKRTIWWILCLAAVLILCLPLTLLGKNPKLDRVRKYVMDIPESETAAKQDEWTFSADRVVGDHTSEYVEAHGNCTLSMGDNELRADFARYYQTTGWVFLKGNIRARWGGDFLEADEGEFDLNNMTGWLKNGKLFMAKPHIYVEAERVGKSKGDSYTFKNAKVTACEGERPAWSVSTEEGDIDLDGQVKLYRSAFRIKDIPVFYWPYMSLPGRMERQTGFLTPHISSSSKLGFQTNLPYYWVINDEMDATFYQNYMSKRGYMQGVEFRHVEDEDSKGMWKVDYLKDSRTADSEADEYKSYNDDGLARPNSNRWWVRGKYNGWLGSPNIKVKVDLDAVSDQNYLRDFNRGPNGFDQTRDDFLDAFGRDIEDKDDNIRTSTLLASRSWDRFGLSSKIQYRQNLEFMNGNGDDDKDTTVQTLPELEAFAFQQRLGSTPVEVAAEAKYDYFTRKYGHTGHRMRLTPELKVPMSNDYVTFIPNASIDHTSYNVSRHEAFGEQKITDKGGRTRTIDTSKVEDGYSSRTTWKAGFTAFSEMTRTFDLEEMPEADPSLAGTSRWTRLRHSVIPRVSYAYTPTITGQDKHPYFDEFDRIDGLNEVTYSLTNVLNRRLDTVVLSPNSGQSPQAALATSYLEFIRFRLEQSYDQNEASRNADRDEYERRPFSDVLAELKIRPREYVDLVTRTWFSPYLTEFTQTEIDVRFFKDGLGEFLVGYDYLTKIDEYKRERDKTLSIARLEGTWEINDEFSLNAIYRHDFNSERDLERTLTLSWFSGCYTLHFGYSQKPDDDRFEFGFDLMNF
ncbi:MAG: organic solvent tolerance protein [Desulfovibrio sp.]|nr:organic solvent tolerance protein [Desulfovibrio sp.]